MFYLKYGALAGAVLAALSFAGPSAAQTTGNPAADAATASANVIIPLTIARTGDLHFGTFVRGSGYVSGSYIEVEPSGTTYSPNAAAFAPLASDPPYVATFDITGAPDFEVIVTQSGPVDLQAGALRLTSFVDDPDLDNSYIIPPGGTVSYRVGGKLRVMNPALVAVGQYSAPFVLTVNYF
jgi:Domain of unknown function (DUF4402)